MSMQKEQIAF